MVMRRMYTGDTKTSTVGIHIYILFRFYHKSLTYIQSFDNITSTSDTEEKKKDLKDSTGMIDLETHLNASK